MTKSQTTSIETKYMNHYTHMDEYMKNIIVQGTIVYYVIIIKSEKNFSPILIVHLIVCTKMYST